ncbi:hypothetical protein M0D69_29430 [Caballeronia sp. SEWSISQ10-4 2]|uniref:hypothetical protein n=1 Tax=Caballeronia sp. SEWSISQ10-4 2 TaxID=2937438 RepID=UPI00264D2173|nr:hypothetical protein [Caballeronia sp. SEWSISQ10-4 2]MDN7182062.1 hypothetical protein [Caballeronia sp. SEWSISQ10-4 2]
MKANAAVLSYAEGYVDAIADLWGLLRKQRMIAAENQNSWCARLGSNQQPLPSEKYKRQQSPLKSMPYTTCEV